MTTAAHLADDNYSAVRVEIEHASSFEKLHAIVERYSAAATREGGVLYSGYMQNRVHSSEVARAIADRDGLAIVDDTPRAQLLANEKVAATLTKTARHLYIASGGDPERARAFGEAFVFGDGSAPRTSPTSLENCLWGRASHEFAQSLRGEVKLVVDNAEADRIFNRVEIPDLVHNVQVDRVVDRTPAAFRELHVHEGLGGVRAASREVGERDFARVPGQSTAYFVERLGHGGMEPVAIGVDVEGSAARVAAGAAFQIATIGLDAAQSFSTAHDLARGGNRSAADSEIVHFATRNVGIAGGALLGAEVSVAAGIESGPGALLTALLGVKRGKRIAA